MNKVIKILSIALVTFFGYILLGTMVKSCNSPKSVIGNVPKQDDYTPTLPPSSEDSYLPEENYDPSVESSQSLEDNTIDYKKIDDLLEKENTKQSNKLNENSNGTSKPLSKDLTNEKKTPIALKENIQTKVEQKTSRTNGKYKVIAGTFANKDNAVKLVNQLKAIGFNQAEIVVFDNAVNHSVIACSFDDENQAKAAKQKIINNGMSAFVSNKN